MGAGIYWYATSHAGAAIEPAAARRTAWRGFVLLITAQIFELPVMMLQNALKPAAVSLNRITAPPPNDGTALHWGLITLSGLGMVMIVCAGLLKLPRYAWLATAAACVLATNTLLPANGRPGPLWNAILLAPGLSQHVIVVYPVIPWLAGAAAGMYFAWWWRANHDSAPNRVWRLGAALLAAAVILRALGGWGNIRPPRDSGWIEFLNNVKYPPSLVFWTMFLGIDLLLLALFARLPAAWTAPRSPFIVFGQTPLFFYLAHFYLLAALAFAFFGEAGSLEQAYAMWLVTLAVLYPVCVRYRAFKSAKPRESLWRMF
jgi:hypothetical protein